MICIDCTGSMKLTDRDKAVWYCGACKRFRVKEHQSPYVPPRKPVPSANAGQETK